MFLLIIALLIIIPGLLVAGFGSPTKNRRGYRGHGVLAIAVGSAVAGATCVCQVPAQSVGVITSFGKPTGRSIGPGLHPKLPWQKETDMDGTVQKLDNLGEHRTPVRLNTNSVLFVDNAFRWKIRPVAGPELYLDWRKGNGNIVEDHVANGLVDNELAAALNVDLASYDPYNRTKPGQSNDELAKAVSTRLFGPDGKSGRIGRLIEEVSFTILSVNFDDATQARLDSINKQRAETNVAREARSTAHQQALANRELASSVSKDPNVLVSRCIDGQVAAENRGANLTGWPSCWPGSENRTQLVQAK